MNHLYRRITAGLGQPVPSRLMRAFRFFFSVHIFLQTLKLNWYDSDDWRLYLVQAIMLAAALLTLHKKLYPLGIAPLLIYKGYWIVSSFPMTGNHGYSETLVLLLLLLFPDRSAEQEGQIEGTGVRLVQFAVLSVYFYAGIHKLVHGLWLQGEFMTHALLVPHDIGMYESIKIVFRALEPLTGFAAGSLPAPPQEFALVGFNLPGWAGALLLAISWLVVATEVGIPLLVAFRSTRRIGIWLMLLVQFGIGAFSWEAEFMFGAIGGILLFFEGHPWRNYLAALTVHVAWVAFFHISGIRIGIL